MRLKWQTAYYIVVATTVVALMQLPELLRQLWSSLDGSLASLATYHGVPWWFRVVAIAVMVVIGVVAVSLSRGKRDLARAARVGCFIAAALCAGNAAWYGTRQLQFEGLPSGDFYTELTTSVSLQFAAINGELALQWLGIGLVLGTVQPLVGQPHRPPAWFLGATVFALYSASRLIAVDFALEAEASLALRLVLIILGVGVAFQSWRNAQEDDTTLSVQWSLGIVAVLCSLVAAWSALPLLDNDSVQRNDVFNAWASAIIAIASLLLMRLVRRR